MGKTKIHLAENLSAKCLQSRVNSTFMPSLYIPESIHFPGKPGNCSVLGLLFSCYWECMTTSNFQHHGNSLPFGAWRRSEISSWASPLGFFGLIMNLSKSWLFLAIVHLWGPFLKWLWNPNDIKFLRRLPRWGEKNSACSLGNNVRQTAITLLYKKAIKDFPGGPVVTTGLQGSKHNLWSGI